MFILLLFRVILTDCDKGCLKCEVDQCLFCDYTEFYQLSEGSCVKSEVEKCELIDIFGNCIVCEPHYYLFEGKCIAV